MPRAKTFPRLTHQGTLKDLLSSHDLFISFSLDVLLSPGKSVPFDVDHPKILLANPLRRPVRIKDLPDEYQRLVSHNYYKLSSEFHVCSPLIELRMGTAKIFHLLPSSRNSRKVSNQCPSSPNATQARSIAIATSFLVFIFGVESSHRSVLIHCV